MMNSLTPHQAHVVSFVQEKINLKPVYLDTETTGLSRSDEIIEISIVEHDGTELFTKLVKPSQPIPREAERIHGITNAQVASAQAWPIIWPQIRQILYGRVIAAYNSPFDLRMMEQSHQRYHLPWREKLVFIDVMQQFSDFRGEWDSFRGSNRLFKLVEAGRYFNISLPNAHRSTADALLTRAVLHSIAGISY